MVNIPKTHRAFCEKCGRDHPHKVTQYKKGRILGVHRVSGVMTGSRVAVVGRPDQASFLQKG